ncbi:MAG: PilN domain-containing protein [Alphaproteobacteria bacterium]|nr:PilN domain-containing protein [Alphaproteobacteria bacterium]
MTLKDIFRWWCGEMAGLLPFRRRAGAAADGFVITVSGERISLARRRAGRMLDLGTFPADARNAAQARRRIGRQISGLMLMVEPHHLLERSIPLPLAASSDPAAVLRYDLDRLTPFEADEVCWGYAVTQRDIERQQITVRLSLVPRAGVRDALAALERIGLPPALLTVRAADGGWRDIALTGTPPRHGAFDRIALRVSAAACAAAVAAALAMPVIRNELRLADAEASIARLRPAMDELATIRRGLATAQAETAAQFDAHGAPGSPLVTLAALTALLPDDTYLTELSLANGRLLLRGQSGNAARLIGLLSADAALRNVSFAAPLTHAAGDTADNFAIQAEMAAKR